MRFACGRRCDTRSHRCVLTIAGPRDVRPPHRRNRRRTRVRCHTRGSDGRYPLPSIRASPSAHSGRCPGLRSRVGGAPPFMCIQVYSRPRNAATPERPIRCLTRHPSSLVALGDSSTGPEGRAESRPSGWCSSTSESASGDRHGLYWHKRKWHSWVPAGYRSASGRCPQRSCPRTSGRGPGSPPVLVGAGHDRSAVPGVMGAQQSSPHVAAVAGAVVAGAVAAGSMVAASMNEASMNEASMNAASPLP
jgi:hypothetical protein